MAHGYTAMEWSEAVVTSREDRTPPEASRHTPKIHAEWTIGNTQKNHLRLFFDLLSQVIL